MFFFHDLQPSLQAEHPVLPVLALAHVDLDGHGLAHVAGAALVLWNMFGVEIIGKPQENGRKMGKSMGSPCENGGLPSGNQAWLAGKSTN